jgi:hypothetical protein
MQSKFLTLDYLKSGSQKQQDVFKLLTENRLFQVLATHHPVLAGTIPLNIDIKGSDLDVICQFDDKHQFKELLLMQFADYPEFRISQPLVLGVETVIANFFIENWEVEIFGQAVSVIKQAAYRHLLAEHNLLQQYGDGLRQQVKALKMMGFKTEPAFARALNLPGDPYEALSAFENE